MDQFLAFLGKRGYVPPSRLRELGDGLPAEEAVAALQSEGLLDEATLARARAEFARLSAGAGSTMLSRGRTTGLAGRTFGAFRLVRERVRRPPATVYEAREERGNRPVQVHVDTDPHVTDEELSRISRQLRAVRNESVARFLDLGRAEGLLWIATELVEGETVRARLDRAGPLEKTEVEGAVRNVLSGLAAVHAEGLVHRHLSSAEILLRAESGRPVVTELWRGQLVRRRRIAEESAASLAYAPPEAFEGAVLEAAADTWAVGVLVFELVTGEAPFPGASAAKAAKAFRRRPRLSAIPPGPLRELARACLQRRPDRRPQGAREALALMRPAKKRGRRMPRWVRVAASVGLAALFTVSVVYGVVRALRPQLDVDSTEYEIATLSEELRAWPPEGLRDAALAEVRVIAEALHRRYSDGPSTLRASLEGDFAAFLQEVDRELARRVGRFVTEVWPADELDAERSRLRDWAQTMQRQWPPAGTGASLDAAARAARFFVDDVRAIRGPVSRAERDRLSLEAERFDLVPAYRDACLQYLQWIPREGGGDPVEWGVADPEAGHLVWKDRKLPKRVRIGPDERAHWLVLIPPVPAAAAGAAGTNGDAGREPAPFYLGEIEVTVDQLGEMPERSPQTLWHAQVPAEVLAVPQDGARTAASCVTWNEAADFAAALGCRLPTAEEWTWACRAGAPAEWDYAWGEDPRGGEGKANVFDRRAAQALGWQGEPFPFDDGHPGPAPPSAWTDGYGLRDMHGNLAEWSASARAEPASLSGAPGRTVHGGSWAAPFPDLVAADAKMTVDAGYRGADVGFRLARDVTP